MNSMNRRLQRPLLVCPLCPPRGRWFDDVGLIQHAITTYKSTSSSAAAHAHICLICEIAENIKHNRRTCNSFQLKIEENMIPENAVKESFSVPPLKRPRRTSTSEGSSVLKHDRSADGDSNLNNIVVKEQDCDSEVVWPWMGIVVNVECILEGSENGKDMVNSFDLGLRARFSCFNPKVVHTYFGKSTHGGMVVLEFGTDVIGYSDAYDFHRKHAQQGRGKEQWLKVLSEKKNPGKEAYGWIADKNDYNCSDEVGELLRTKGSLRNLSWKELLNNSVDELYVDLTSKLQEKNTKLMEYVTENINLQRQLYQTENVKYSLEITHKRETELMKKNVMARDAEILELKEKLSIVENDFNNIKKQYNDLEEKYKSDTKDWEQVTDLIEEKELLQECYQHILCKERTLNDEIQNAKRKATEILQMLDGGRSIGVKRIGELDDKPWRQVCAAKFEQHEEGWEAAFLELLSLWESYLHDSSWCPFKTVGTGKEEIDENDEKLVKLREEFGDDVYMTVVNALNELQQYNPSGRYNISIPWNFQQGREATMEEIITYLTKGFAKKRRWVSC